MRQLFFAILLLLSLFITGCNKNIKSSESLVTEISSVETISSESYIDLPFHKDNSDKLEYLHYLAFQTKKNVEHDTRYGSGVLTFNYEILSEDSISITIEYPASSEIDENELSDTIISRFSHDYSVNISYIQK